MKHRDEGLLDRQINVRLDEEGSKYLAAFASARPRPFVRSRRKARAIARRAARRPGFVWIEERATMDAAEWERLRARMDFDPLRWESFGGLRVQSVTVDLATGKTDVVVRREAEA